MCRVSSTPSPPGRPTSTITRSGRQSVNKAMPAAALGASRARTPERSVCSSPHSASRIEDWSSMTSTVARAPEAAFGVMWGTWRKVPGWDTTNVPLGGARGSRENPTNEPRCCGGNPTTAPPQPGGVIPWRTANLTSVAKSATPSFFMMRPR